MAQKIKCFFVSLVAGLVLTVLAIGAQYAIAEIHFHIFTAIGITVIWLIYSLLLWGSFFKDIPRGQAFLSNRFVICSSIGLVVTLLILGAMISLDKIGAPPTFTKVNLKNINPTGVICIWILLGALFYGKKLGR